MEQQQDDENTLKDQETYCTFTMSTGFHKLAVNKNCGEQKNKTLKEKEGQPIWGKTKNFRTVLKRRLV